MHAIEITEPGGPEVLQWREVADPEPGPGEVVIEVAAAGINRADLMQRRGLYPPPHGASPYPGLECSGRVVAVGEAADEALLGREVCALLPGGGYATKVAVHASLTLPIPDGVSLVDAAYFPEVAATVWSMLFRQWPLKGGEMLLVHGGAGGIGTFAIQLASAVGVGVFTTARPQNHQALRQLGAELVIDYREQDFSAEVAEYTDGQGVDVILDNIGAANLEKNLAALRTGGRLAIIGMQGGRSGTLDIGALLAKRAMVHAAGLRARPLSERGEIMAEVGKYVWPLVASGLLRPLIAERLELSQAARGHEILQNGGHLGKVLLVA